MTVLLDSWAVLRLLEGVEPTATRVQEELDGPDDPVMSWINLGEVYCVVRRLHGDEAANAVVRDLRPRVALDLPDEERVLQAATIKSQYPMSYADAFAAATALAHDATVLTGDPELLLAAAPWRHEDLRST